MIFEQRSLKYQIMAGFVTRVRTTNSLDTKSVKKPVPNRLCDSLLVIYRQTLDEAKYNEIEY